MQKKTFFHSILITGGEAKEREDAALEMAAGLFSENGKPKTPLTMFGCLIIRPEGKTIGIERIRDLKKDLSLKPLRGKSRAVIILEAQEMTVEAQNSLLKTLEEPPDKTTIILTAPHKNFMLPTLVSRCLVKETGLVGYEPGSSPQENLSIMNILSRPKGERLTLVETNQKVFCDRLSLSALIDDWIEELRGHLLGGKLPENRDSAVRTLDNLLKVKQVVLETNAGVRLQVESFLLDPEKRYSPPTM